MSTPDEWARKAEKEADAIADARVAEFLGQLESARKDMLAAILDTSEYDRVRLNRLLRQLDNIMADTRMKLGQIQPVATDSAPLAALTTEKIVELTVGKSLSIGFDRLNTELLQQFADANLNQVVSLTEAQVKKVKSILVNKVGIQGNNPQQVARQLVAKDSEFTKLYGHVENILRTETSTIFNAQSIESIKVTNEDLSLKNQLKKRIVETMDKERNHPISRVLNGQVKSLDEPFEALVSDIEAAGKAIGVKYPLGGILWQRKGDKFTGMNLPAHYRERGVVVASR